MNDSATARNRAFVKRCLELIERRNRNNAPVEIREIVAEAIASPPPCHFAGYKLASHNICRLVQRMRKHPDTQRASNLRQQCWFEMAQQVMAEMDGPRKLTFAKALSFVLNFRRPSRYYLTEERALRLLRPYIERRSVIRPRRPKSGI